MDPNSKHAKDRTVVYMKYTKEAYFCAGVAMILDNDGKEVSERVPLLNYAEKRLVSIREYDELVVKEIRRTKGLPGEKRHMVSVK